LADDVTNLLRWGVREVPITKKKKPVGYVAFCNVCNWSTGIHTPDTEGKDAAYKRADQQLVEHLRSREHFQNT